MKISRLFFCLFVSFVASACASHRPPPKPPAPTPIATYRVSTDQAVVAFEAGSPWTIVSDQDQTSPLIFQHEAEMNGVLAVFIIDAPPGSTIEEVTAYWWSLLQLMPEDVMKVTEKTLPIAVSEEESTFTFIGTADGMTPTKKIVRVPMTARARIVLVSDHTNDAWIMVWVMSPTTMASEIDAEADRVIQTLRIDPPE